MPDSPITSPFAPDLAAVRAWLEKMIAAAKFVELVTAMLALFCRMAEINAELARRLAQTRRKHPRSETLDRLSRQLVLPLNGIVTVAPAANVDDDAPPPKPKPPRHTPDAPHHPRTCRACRFPTPCRQRCGSARSAALR